MPYFYALGGKSPVRNIEKDKASRGLCISTRILLILKPASISIAIATCGLVGLVAARAPLKAAMKRSLLDYKT